MTISFGASVNPLAVTTTSDAGNATDDVGGRDAYIHYSFGATSRKGFTLLGVENREKR